MRKSIGILILAALGAVACGQASSPTAPSDNSTMLTVFIRGGAFSPNPLTVKQGMSVNWKNEDSVNHNAVLEGKFDSGVIPPLSAHSVPAVMNTAGTFNYHCTLHAGETGSIVVVP